MISGKRYLLFDLDHTLWDCEGNSVESLKKMYEGHGIASFFSTFEEFNDVYQEINDALWIDFGKGLMKVEEVWLGRFSKTLESRGVRDDKLARDLSEEYKSLMRTASGVMPHAHEVLEALKKRYVIGVASNGVAVMQFAKITSSGLDKYIDHYIVSDEVGEFKPNRGFFDRVIERLGCQASDCLMIGDNPTTDIKGAMDAGIDAIWYRSREYGVEVEATMVINDLSELVDILL